MDIKYSDVKYTDNEIRYFLVAYITSVSNTVYLEQHPSTSGIDFLLIAKEPLQIR